jgi:hypothetical protein
MLQSISPIEKVLTVKQTWFTGVNGKIRILKYIRRIDPSNKFNMSH